MGRPDTLHTFTPTAQPMSHRESVVRSIFCIYSLPFPLGLSPPPLNPHATRTGRTQELLGGIMADGSISAKWQK